MGFSLKNLLEEASAQLNTRDGGKTAATIRANRVQTPPAQTVSKPSNAYDKIRNFTNTVESVTPIGVARKLSPRFNKVADTYETGLTRSFAGGLEGMSGLVDLATPGTGTNRVTKYAQEVGRNTDAYVKDNNLSVPVYKAGQLAGEVSQAIAPSAVASAATQGTRFAGMGAKINSAKPLLGSPAKAVANESRLVRGANAAARYATQPKNVVNFGTNLLQNQGYRAAQGQDINAGTIAQDVAINAAFQGGGELASKAAGKVVGKVSGVAGDVLRNKNLKPQINTPKKQPTYGTNSNEAYTLGDYADAITGRKPVDNKTLNKITKTARAVAANEGLDINTGSLKDRDLRIADYLEARDNAQRAAEKGVLPAKSSTGLVSKIKDVIDNRTRLNEVGSIGRDIRDPLDALKQEARKYKSAEEFLDSKEKLYHGSKTTIDQLKPGGAKGQYGETQIPGIYTTPDVEFASWFAQNRGVQVNRPMELYSALRNPLEADSIKDLAKKLGVSPDDTQRIVDTARERGYDGVILNKQTSYKNGSVREVIPFNNTGLVSREQLTDLYNQANKPSLKDKLIAPFKDEIGAAGPGVGKLRDEMNGGTLLPNKAPEPYKNNVWEGSIDPDRANKIQKNVDEMKEFMKSGKSKYADLVEPEITKTKVPKKKSNEDFKTEAMKVRDNLKAGEKGYITDGGKTYEISRDSTRAKVVQTPKEAYHSTAALEIEGGKLRPSNDGAMGPGVYLHSNEGTAKTHAAYQGDGNIADQTAYKVKINTDKIHKLPTNNYPSPQEVAAIKASGSEGIMLKDGEMVIFDPNKVELATQPPNPDLPRRSQSPLRAGMSESEFFQRMNPNSPDATRALSQLSDAPDVPSVSPKQLPQEALSQGRPQTPRLRTAQSDKEVPLPNRTPRQLEIKESTAPFSNEQQKLVKDYADMLRYMGEGNGVTVNKATGKRISNNVRNAETKGKNMTKTDWFLEAKRQLDSGKADKYAQADYDKLLKDANDPEVQALLNRQPEIMPDTPEAQNALAAEKLAFEAKQAKPNTIDMNDIPVDQPAFTLKESKGGDKMKVRVNKDTKKLESFIEPNDRLAQLDAMGSKAPDTELPPASQDQINTVLERGSLKDKTVKKQLDDLTNEYLGGRKAVDINRQRTIADLEKRYQLSDAEKLNAIEVIDGSSGTAPMNQKVADYAAQFKNITDSAYADYAGKGVKMGYQNEYLPRIYQDPKTGRQLTAQEYNLLTTGSKRQKGRTSDSLYTEHLVSQDPNELLSKYYNSLDNAVAGRQYLDGLEKNGLVITSTTPVAGMRPIVAEGLQPSNGGVYYARKEVADKLNTMFGDKSPSGALEKALDKGAKINNLWQTIKLSGGVPGTPINSFGIMQSVKEAMAGNPINAGKGFLAGTSKKYAEKLFTQRADIVQRMAENGVDPRINYRKTFKSIGDKIAAETGMKGKTAAAWHAAVDDPTFGRMMPAFQLLHYDTVFNKYVGKMGEKEAGRLAAESTRNFYGMNTMAKDAFRSNATKDALGAALFAPRFREGMVNFWLKNAKALGHPTDPAYRSNMKFLVSAAATYAAMDAINYQLNGEHLYQNPDGKKDKLLVPGGVIPGSPEDKTIGIPYLSSIATVPRNVATTVGSALTGNTKEVGKGITSFAAGPIQTGGQILNNENYFGRQIYDEQASAPEKFGSIASYTLQNTNQPWVAEALNAGANKLPDNVKKFVGAKDKSAFETIANATESPLRFYDPNYMKYGGVGLTKDQREAAATVSNPSEYRKEAIAVNAAEKKQKKSDEKEIDKIKNGGKSDSTSDKVQKAKFEAGDEKEKVIGDTYYYKTKSGTVKSKPKAEYEYDKATSGVKLEMDRAKANDDVNKWFEQADKEYNALEAKKKSYDETTEKDQIDKITLQQENLLDEAKKYKTYGGFKKPKKGKGGKGGKKAKKFDYSLTGFTKKSASDKTLRALLKKATSKA